MSSTAIAQACCCAPQGLYHPFLQGYSCGLTVSLTVDWSNVRWVTHDNNGAYQASGGSPTGHECDPCQLQWCGSPAPGAMHSYPCQPSDISSANLCSPLHGCLSQYYAGFYTYPTTTFVGTFAGAWRLCKTENGNGAWTGNECASGSCEPCGCGAIPHTNAAPDCTSLLEDAYHSGGMVVDHTGAPCNRAGVQNCCSNPRDNRKWFNYFDNGAAWADPALSTRVDKSYCMKALERHEPTNGGWSSNAIVFTRTTPVVGWLPQHAVTQPWVTIDLRTIPSTGLNAFAAPNCTLLHEDACESTECALTSSPGNCYHPTVTPIHAVTGLPYKKWVSIKVDGAHEYHYYGTNHHYKQWAQSNAALSAIVTVTTDPDSTFWLGLRVEPDSLDTVTGLLTNDLPHTARWCNNIQGFYVSCAHAAPPCTAFIADNSDEFELYSMTDTVAVFRARHRYWYRVSTSVIARTTQGSLGMLSTDVCCGQGIAGCAEVWEYWGSAVDGTPCFGTWNTPVPYSTTCNPCCNDPRNPCVGTSTGSHKCMPSACSSPYYVAASWGAGGVFEHCDSPGWIHAGVPSASVYDTPLVMPCSFRTDSTGGATNATGCLPINLNMGGTPPSVCNPPNQGGGYPTCT